MASPLPKACENCRIRKVRCNRVNPCSNCQTSNIPCRPALTNQRRKARIANGRPSSQTSSRGSNPTLNGHSPTDVDLAGSKSTQSIGVVKVQSSAVPHSPSTDNLRVLAEAAEQSPATTCPFEGSSSFNEQALHASRMVGVDVEPLNGVPGASHPDSILTAIESQSEPECHEYCFRGNPQRNQDMQLEMPPASFVLDLLKELKKRPSKVFLAYCMHLLVPDLEALCQAAYFPIKPMSFGALATMYGMLYYLTSDLYIEPESPLAKKYSFDIYSKLLEKNFHFALENYSVVVTPTDDNIKALCIGIMKAHSDTKPLLCWSLTCAAARQVLGLGYHRESTFNDMSPAESDTGRALFWFVYVFDKCLALRLGRTPNIQDYDIDVKWYKVSDDPSIAPYERTNIHFAKLARISGLIYERLYSLGALRAPLEDRMQSVQKLSAELHQWREEWRMFDNSQAAYGSWFRACFHIVEPIYYATQALVHRASSTPGTSTEITPTCYEAARQSLRAYLEAFKSMQGESSYMYVHCFVDEIMFYTSLTPLIIIFLHTITTPNYSDVDLLVKCQETLEHLKSHSTETARVLRVCKVFCRIARSRLQVASDTSQSAASSVSSGSGPLSNLHKVIKSSTSSDWSSVSHDEFGSFSTPEDFDINQMNAFFTGWLEQDRMPTELFDMDFVSH